MVAELDEVAELRRAEALWAESLDARSEAPVITPEAASYVRGLPVGAKRTQGL